MKKYLIEKYVCGKQKLNQPWIRDSKLMNSIMVYKYRDKQIIIKQTLKHAVEQFSTLIEISSVDRALIIKDKQKHFS